MSNNSPKPRATIPDKLKSTESKILRMDALVSSSRPLLIINSSYSEQVERRWDMHFGIEFGILLKGKMRRYYSSHEEDCVPGQIWFCGMWEPHGFSVTDAPCQAAVCVILPQWLASAPLGQDAWFNALAPFAALPTQRPQTKGVTRNKMLDLGKQIWTLSQSPSSHREVWLRLLVIQALLMVSDQIQKHPTPKAVDTSHFNVIEEAMGLVYREPRLVTETEAAHACRLSRKTFSRIFFRLVGIRFADYCLRYRLDGAMLQLRQTDIPLKQVASNWGFADTSHFHRCFSAAFRCTPATYRLKHYTVSK